MSHNPIIKRAADITPAPVEGANDTTIRVLLGPDDGMPNFFLREFTLLPGARIPTHRHPDIEHEQLMLAGEMVVGLDDQVCTVRTGDSLFIPAGTAHWYENQGTVPVAFLCAVPRTEGYATEWLES